MAAAFEAADGRPRRAPAGRARRRRGRGRRRARAAVGGAARGACRGRGVAARVRPARGGPPGPAGRAAPAARLQRAYELAEQAEELVAEGRRRGRRRCSAGGRAGARTTSCCSGPASPPHRRATWTAARRVRAAAEGNPRWLELLERLSPDFAPAGAVRCALALEPGADRSAQQITCRWKSRPALAGRRVVGARRRRPGSAAGRGARAEAAHVAGAAHRARGVRALGDVAC